MAFDARQKKMGYLEVKTTRTLRMTLPATEGLNITVSAGNPVYPPASVKKAVLRMPLPSENKPMCVLIGRNPYLDGPSFYTAKHAISTLIHTALNVYHDADEHKGPSEKRLPVILATLGEALHAAGLPPITHDVPPVDIVALLPGGLISRLAGLMVFRQGKDGVYCSVTKVSLNDMCVAMHPSLVDFSSVGSVSAGSWQVQAAAAQ
jgi:hypothetical protein